MVNETFGRKAGDDLLREIGERLRAGGARAGHGGARRRRPFRHRGGAVRPAGRHRSWLSRAPGPRPSRARSLIDGVELRVTLKAGIAVFPADGDSTEALCANAETALNQAKHAGVDYLFYAPEMNARVAESLAMEHRLRRALEDGRLSLHYQPKIDMRTGRLAGLEALIRWQIPSSARCRRRSSSRCMEETGMILVAGRWALGQRGARTSCTGNRSASRCRAPRSTSRRSSCGRRTSSTRCSRRSRSSAAPQPLLDLEITESVLLDDIDETRASCRRCAAPGSRFRSTTSAPATARSAISRACRSTSLKIDRSFVVRMRDAGYPRNIVAMIVSLAHTLGLKVVAEGVEDDEQVRLLQATSAATRSRASRQPAGAAARSSRCCGPRAAASAAAA